MKKIGVGIQADLKRLAKEVGTTKPYTGYCNLAAMAEERGLVPSKRVGLAELCARILHYHLDKDPNIRLSTVWEDPELPPAHVQYAALDAWASLQIYKRLLMITLPGKLERNAPAGTEVALWTEDHHSIAAYGILADHSLKTVGSFKLLKQSHTIVQVTKVVKPASLLSTHKKASLASFGSTPFHVICQWRHLQLHSNDNSPSVQVHGV